MSGLIRPRMFGLLALAAATPLLAAPADTIRTRIAGFRELGAAFKAVNDSLRSDTVQTVLVRQSAREIRSAGQHIAHWFPAGTGPQAGIKTRAKADIWTKPRDFRKVQVAFSRQTIAFQRAANGTDIEKIRTEARKLGGTCKGCHDLFQGPKE